MASSTTLASTSFTPTQLVETRKMALGLRLSLYAMIVGIISLLFPFLLITVYSLPFLKVSETTFLRWLSLSMMWVFAGTTIVSVLASVLMIGAPEQIKVFRIGLIYAICTLLACMLAGTTLMGGVGIGGALALAFRWAQYPAWLLYVDRVAKFTAANNARKVMISGGGPCMLNDYRPDSALFVTHAGFSRWPSCT